jgi:hypothetical protein
VVKLAPERGFSVDEKTILVVALIALVIVVVLSGLVP